MISLFKDIDRIMPFIIKPDSSKTSLFIILGNIFNLIILLVEHCGYLCIFAILFPATQQMIIDISRFCKHLSVKNKYRNKKLCSYELRGKGEGENECSTVK